MYILMPKDFFTQESFSGEFTYTSNSTHVEYDSEKPIARQNNNVKKVELENLKEKGHKHKFEDISMLYDVVIGGKRDMTPEQALEFHIKHIRDIISNHIKTVKCMSNLNDEKQKALVERILASHESRFKTVFKNHLNILNCGSIDPMSVEDYIVHYDIENVNKIYNLIDDEYSGEATQ